MSVETKQARRRKYRQRLRVAGAVTLASMLASGCISEGAVSSFSHGEQTYSTSATPSPTHEVIQPIEPERAPFQEMLFYKGGGFPGSQLVLSNYNGTGEKVIPVTGTEPVWSPNGKSFAVENGLPSDQEEICIFDNKGKAVRTIHTGFVKPETIVWLPDGRGLLYQQDTAGVWKANLNTGKVKNILDVEQSTVDNSLSLSPNGKQFVVVHHEWGLDYFIRLFDTDNPGAGYIQLDSGTTNHYDAGFAFTWPNDGHTLVTNSTFADLTKLSHAKRDTRYDYAKFNNIPLPKVPPGNTIINFEDAALVNSKVARVMTVGTGTRDEEYFYVYDLKGQVISKAKLPDDVNPQDVIWPLKNNDFSFIDSRQNYNGPIKTTLYVAHSDGTGMEELPLPKGIEYSAIYPQPNVG